MRYYSFNEYSEQGNIVETWSEQEVRERYYPYWYQKMCERFGQEHVDANFSFEECLDDWVVVNWAWEVTSGKDSDNF